MASRLKTDRVENTLSRERGEFTSQATCDKAELKGINVERGEETTTTLNPRKITATTIIGDKVKNREGKELGKIEEIMLDLTCGTVSYIVLSVGGIAGIGDKFFAVPLDALTMNTTERAFYLDIDKKTLTKSNGFDKHNWPQKAEWQYAKSREEVGLKPITEAPRPRVREKVK